ncbi:hypothetical protein NB717_001389 [Xanthomonas sacchari]|nr:hypothetical protein [Xanthomonas sacchari]
MAALAAGVHRHVLDDAQHRHLDLLEHLQRLLRVQRGDVLRGGDDHRTGHRDLLRQGQLDVAGAGRQVDQQVVQVVPQGIGEQLCERRGRHRTAPDHRRVLVHQQPDRHRLDAEGAHRLDALVVRTVRAPAQAEHGRHAGAVDVGIQHADARALALQGQGQVHGSGGLAHPALAGADGDDVADARVRGELGLDGVGGETRAFGHRETQQESVGDAGQACARRKGNHGPHTAPRASAAARAAQTHDYTSAPTHGPAPRAARALADFAQMPRGTACDRPFSSAIARLGTGPRRRRDRGAPCRCGGHPHLHAPRWRVALTEMVRRQPGRAAGGIGIAQSSQAFRGTARHAPHPFSNLYNECPAMVQSNAKFVYVGAAARRSPTFPA